MVKGEKEAMKNIKWSTPPPTTTPGITHFKVYKNAKEMVRLRCFCGAPIQDGGLKRKWVSAQNNGYLSNGF